MKVFSLSRWLLAAIFSCSSFGAWASDPADIRHSPRLTLSEQNYILSLQAGERYFKVESGGSSYIKDEKEPRHLLGASEIGALLSPRSNEIVDRLRKRYGSKDSPLPEDLKEEAYHQLYVLGPALSPQNEQFLTRKLGLSAPDIEGKLKNPFIDRQSEVSSGGGAVASEGLPSGGDEPEDYQAFLSRIHIASGGDEHKADILKGSLRLLLDSPTGARLVKRFILEGPEIKLSFAKMDDTVFCNNNGEQRLSGTMAQTAPGPKQMRVTVNEAYLKLSKQSRWSDGRLKHAIASNLAHEILGHALELKVARDKGIYDAYGLYRDNETNAAVVGWLVAAELGDKLDDGFLWSYMQNIDQYYNQTSYWDYAVMLSREELKNPVESYWTHMGQVENHSDEWKEGDKAAIQVIWAITHFSGPRHPQGDELHRQSADFDVLTDEAMKKRFDFPRVSKKAQEDVIRRIRNIISQLQKDPALAAKLAGNSSHPQFDEWERQLTENTEALKSCLRGRSLDTERPVRPKGQVTFKGLQEMIRKDKALHPEHWKRP